MIRLSVNVNKVATLRNSRGGLLPSVVKAVQVCLDAGVKGITVHPRADRRHITPEDVRAIARLLANRPGVEFNIEGDPRPDLLELVDEIQPQQCTLVPVAPGEITSQAGWRRESDDGHLAAAIGRIKARRVRVSVFVDPEPEAVAFAASVGADRVELYTEQFARAFEAGPESATRSFQRYSAAARTAETHSMQVNAGHDLDLDNLEMFRRLPFLAEVSIGHALISHALFVGLDRAVRDYLDAVRTE